MSTIPLVFERDYEFPRVIVWDVLVDAELVSGWLAEAVIAPELGGEYALRWPNRPGVSTVGRIVVFRPLDRLRIETTNGGGLQFELAVLPGGSRGTSTRLRLTVDLEIEPAFAPQLQADWVRSLDQLEDLLRGHPVDWDTRI